MSDLEGFNAVLYARVSTDDKGQTTESQIREMRKWCEARKITILDEYRDEKSGKDLDRPEFDRMLGRIARGGVDILLAWSESRLTRDGADMLFLQEITAKFNTKIRYVTNANEPETEAGTLVNYIGTWQAQVERQKLIENTKNGMLTANLKGVHCGRPLAIAFAHNYERDKKKIRLEGNKPTKIVSLESVLKYASEGLSTGAAAQRIGVSRPTLEFALKEEGKLEFYKETAKNVKNECKKGAMQKRVLEINTNLEKGGNF